MVGTGAEQECEMGFKREVARLQQEVSAIIEASSLGPGKAVPFPPTN
jgi:hypothetical protein